MKTPSQIIVFDRKLLRQRRVRAAREFAQYDFLHRAVAKQISERLLDLTKDFSNVMVLGQGDPDWFADIRNKKNIKTFLHGSLTAPADIILDEEFLPLKPQSFDAIISLLDLQFVNDVPGCLLQIKQALKPDGLFLGAFFGGRSLTELRQSLMQAEIESTSGASPRVIPFADLQDAAALMQRVQFALPVADSDMLTVTYPDLFRLMRDLRGMGVTNTLVTREKKPPSRDMFIRAAQFYQDHFPSSQEDGSAGGIQASFEVIYLAGWAPAATQQQPLRPGTASAKLADALDTIEIPTSDKARP